MGHLRRAGQATVQLKEVETVLNFASLFGHRVKIILQPRAWKTRHVVQGFTLIQQGGNNSQSPALFLVRSPVTRGHGDLSLSSLTGTLSAQPIWICSLSWRLALCCPPWGQPSSSGSNPLSRWLAPPLSSLGSAQLISSQSVPDGGRSLKFPPWAEGPRRAHRQCVSVAGDHDHCTALLLATVTVIFVAPFIDQHDPVT